MTQAQRRITTGETMLETRREERESSKVSSRKRVKAEYEATLLWKNANTEVRTVSHLLMYVTDDTNKAET